MKNATRRIQAGADVPIHARSPFVKRGICCRNDRSMRQPQNFSSPKLLRNPRVRTSR